RALLTPFLLPSTTLFRSEADQMRRSMNLSRRGFLQLSGGVAHTAGLGVGLGGCAEQFATGRVVPSTARLPEPFTVPLQIPQAATDRKSTLLNSSHISSSY